MSLASVGSSTTKTFINSLTHCHETFHRHSWIPEEEQSRLFYFFSSATMRLTPAVLSEISSDAQNPPFYRHSFHNAIVYFTLTGITIYKMNNK